MTPCLVHDYLQQVLSALSSLVRLSAGSHPSCCVAWCSEWSCLDGQLCLQGFAVQGLVTGEGPYANWAKHVSDPFGYNLLTILGNEDRLPTL